MARKIRVADVTVAAGGHAPVESSRISQNQGVRQGKMIGYKMAISNCPNAINVVLQIKDSDGDVIYTSPGEAKGGTRIRMGLDIPLVERETVVIDPDGDPGAGGVTVSNITLYYHPDVTELQVR
jgi:hypothetical protein